MKIKNFLFASMVLLSGSMTCGPAAAQTAVPVQHFTSLELRGGGHVVLRHGGTQEVRLLKGSTQYTGFTVEQSGRLVIDACNAACPQRYDLEIEVTTPDIAGVAVSGGGSIESSSGFPHRQKLATAVNGGGRVDLRSIDAAETTAAVHGGGHIMVKARDELTAAVDGGGHIEYWGDPGRMTKAINGGGEVSKGS